MHARSIIVACGILTAMCVCLLVIGFIFSGGVDPNPPGVSATISECRQISVALNAYKNDFGAYPRGSAADIMKALHGSNPDKITYVDQRSIKTNDDGSPMDAWKHPIEITFDSEGQPTVSSPGKDGVYKKGWRSDDIKI